MDIFSFKIGDEVELTTNYSNPHSKRDKGTIGKILNLSSQYAYFGTNNDKFTVDIRDLQPVEPLKNHPYTSIFK